MRGSRPEWRLVRDPNPSNHYRSAGGLQNCFQPDLDLGLTLDETRDRLDSSQAAGEFDDDSIDDLTVGITYEDISATSNAGAVHVIFCANTAAIRCDGNPSLRSG